MIGKESVIPAEHHNDDDDDDEDDGGDEDDDRLTMTVIMTIMHPQAHHGGLAISETWPTRPVYL